MPKSSKSKSTKTSVTVRNLPTSEKEMTTKDMKKLKGGTSEVQTVTLTGSSSGAFSSRPGPK